MQMECLCHINFEHKQKSDEQFNSQLRQMPLNTTWKKKHYIKTHVQVDNSKYFNWFGYRNDPKFSDR